MWPVSYQGKLGINPVCVCVCVCVCLSVCLSVCLFIPPIIARQLLVKNSLIIARQRLSKKPLIVARQQLGRYVTAVTNTHATIEELLDASFSMWPVPYQGK
jgi:hypothetical protein